MVLLSNKSHWLELNDNLLISAPDERIHIVYWKNGYCTKYSMVSIETKPDKYMWLAEYAMRNCIQANINQ